MSRSNLKGRQAQVERNGGYVMGSFEDDGREVVKKEFKSGKAADKPGFFLGGSDPTVPTGPRRKLRTSWIAGANDTGNAEETKSSSSTTPPPPVIPKPTKKWTPVAKRELPTGSSSSHHQDGTVSGTLKKSSSVGAGAVLKEEKPAVESKEKQETNTKEETKKEEATIKEEVVLKTEKTPKAEEEPPKLAVQEEHHHKSKERSVPSSKTPPMVQVVAAKAARPETIPESAAKSVITTNALASTSDNDAAKDEEIKTLKEEIAQLKEEKGELAKQVKKIKSSAKVNTELKEEISQLKEQLNKNNANQEDSKKFHKLENKLNTLKMVVDGHVNMNSLEDLQDHVNMIKMVLNQDLKKDGMKNVWA